MFQREEAYLNRMLMSDETFLTGKGTEGVGKSVSGKY